MKIAVIADPESPHVQSRMAAMAARGHAIEWLETLPDALDADVVHVHYAANKLAWSSLMRRAWPPVAVTVMGGDVMDAEQHALPRTARWLVRTLLRAASLVTVKTPHLGDVVRALGVAPERIADIPWGVDDTVFAPGKGAGFRDKCGIPATAPLVFSPRIIRPFYNHHLLIDALPALIAAVPDVRVLFTGHGADPAYERDLTARAEKAGVTDHVVWTGVLSKDDMARAYCAAEVVVSLAPSDGFPQSVWEAMACETACLVPDLVHLRNVICLGRDAEPVELSADALAATLGALLGDPDRRRQVAAAGAEAVRRVGSLSENAVRLERALTAALEKPAARPGPAIRLWVRAIFVLWSLRDGALGRGAGQGAGR